MKLRLTVRHGARVRLPVRERGLTLVELMVAMALGLVILIGVVYVFAGSRASYRHQESYSAVQESGRIALELMGRDLRMAGHTGCGNLGFLRHVSAPVNNPPLEADVSFDDATAITGTDNVAGTPDLVTLVAGSADFTTLTSMPSPNEMELTSVAALGTVNPGDLLLLSDCVWTEVVVVQAVAGNTITLNPPPTQQYRPGTVVMRREWIQYTVNPATRELQRNGVAIAGSVTDMQLRYGVGDTTRSATNYVTNPTAVTPTSIVAIKVDLTIADGNVNRPFSTTVTLRNRAP